MELKNNAIPKSVPDPIKTYDILLGPNIKVTTDKKSKTKVINFPFDFPDGIPGVLIICRVKDTEWTPSKTIRKINIEFT